MVLRYVGAIFCLCVYCFGVKAESDNVHRIRLRCNDSPASAEIGQAECSLKSTRCVLKGYEINRGAEVSHPKETYYISCLIFEKVKINMIPEHFFSEYAAVKFINLGHSKIHKLADFALSLTYITEINLRGNELISLTANVFEGAENLRKIDLGNNMISSIQPEIFSTLRSLEDLDLSNNQLHNNSFNQNGADWTDTIESLKSLDLSNNKLFYYDVMPYQAFSGLINLNTLKLRANRIKIDYGAFASNQKLQTLDFSFNKMTYFDLNYLLSIKSLENLYLHGNGISYASQVDLTDVRASFPVIQSIGISENSFSCEVLAVIVKKMDKTSIKLVIEDDKFINNRRNLRGVSCV